MIQLDLNMNTVTKEILLMLMTTVCFIVGAFVLVDIEFMDSLANMTSVFEGLSWFIALFLSASLFTAYLVIVADIKFIIRFLAIPLWLVFTLSTLITIDKFLGYAYPVVPPKSTLIAYRIFLDTEAGVKKIESWMYDRSKGTTRLYVYDWNEEREEELKKGKASAKAGAPIDIDLLGTADDRPFGKLQGSNIDHGIKHRGLPPKSDESERR